MTPPQGKSDELRDALLAIQARAYVDDDEQAHDVKALVESLDWIYSSAGEWAGRIGDAPQDAMHPSSGLLVKLGSALVHAEEALSPDGHQADIAAFEGLLADAEVAAWMEAMAAKALLPIRR